MMSCCLDTGILERLILGSSLRLGLAVLYDNTFSQFRPLDLTRRDALFGDLFVPPQKFVSDRLSVSFIRSISPSFT